MINLKTIEENLKNILHLLKELVSSNSSNEGGAYATKYVYSNQETADMLGVDTRYLKTLRDNGLIGYSRHKDKFWYRHIDVDQFLATCHCEAFNQTPGRV